MGGTHLVEKTSDMMTCSLFPEIVFILKKRDDLTEDSQMSLREILSYLFPSGLLRNNESEKGENSLVEITVTRGGCYIFKCNGDEDIVSSPNNPYAIKWLGRLSQKIQSPT
jgi:hypothetical protein